MAEKELWITSTATVTYLTWRVAAIAALLMLC